jgi:integrase
VSAVIGLIAAAGLRTSEALTLDCSDVNLVKNTIRVTGKYGKIRMLPVHQSTVDALASYLYHSRRQLTGTPGLSFFVTADGTRPRADSIRKAFRRLCVQCHLPMRPGDARPRLLDLRHSFATASLLQAYRDGVDIDAHVAALATYLGHVSPASTYWYLSSSPELFTLVAERLAAHQEGRSS